MKNRWTRSFTFIIGSSIILSGTISSLGWFGWIGISIMFGYLVAITNAIFYSPSLFSEDKK